MQLAQRLRLDVGSAATSSRALESQLLAAKGKAAAERARAEGLAARRLAAQQAAGVAAGGARDSTGEAGAARSALVSPPRAAARADELPCASGGGGSAAPRTALVSDGERALAAAREAVARVLAEQD